MMRYASLECIKKQIYFNFEDGLTLVREGDYHRKKEISYSERKHVYMGFRHSYIHYYLMK
jgi:hypothetical protein